MTPKFRTGCPMPVLSNQPHKACFAPDTCKMVRPHMSASPTVDYRYTYRILVFSLITAGPQKTPQGLDIRLRVCIGGLETLLARVAKALYNSSPSWALLLLRVHGIAMSSLDLNKDILNRDLRFRLLLIRLLRPQVSKQHQPCRRARTVDLHV